MESLSHRDLRGLLELARDLASSTDLHAVSACLLAGLRRLIPCDIASFNEIDLSDARGRSRAVIDPPDAWIPGAEEIIATYAHQNPLIAAAALPGGLQALRLSDFISRRQLHGLELYDLLYQQTETEHQLAVALHAPPQRVIGVALNRRALDFTERDRRLLDLLRPFVARAYEHALIQERLRDATRATGDRDADRAPFPGLRPPADPLTAREQEVLELVAAGMTNPEIAATLVLSPRTVAKHLEHIYEKLRVHTRIAAVTRAAPRAHPRIDPSWTQTARTPVNGSPPIPDSDRSGQPTRTGSAEQIG